MKIAKGTFVRIEYTLTLDSGQIADRSPEGEALPFICGEEHILPILEKGLVGLEDGTETEIIVEPADGFGESDPDLVREMPRSKLPPDADLEPGTLLAVHTPHGMLPMRVKELRGETVLVDCNHPMAGQRLHFNVKIVEVRKATDEDREAFRRAQHHCDHAECHDCGGKH